MGFDKHMGKERRKPYYRRGKNATGCRPNGGCPSCLNDRMYQQNKAKMHAGMETEEALDFWLNRDWYRDEANAEADSLELMELL